MKVLNEFGSIIRNWTWDRLYSSQIFNSWFAQGVKVLFALIALPVVLTKLTVEEANVWFLFSTIVAIGQAMQFGFNTTFIRFIAYSFAGVPVEKFASIKENFKVLNGDKKPTREFFEIFVLLRRVFTVLSGVFFLLLVVFGSWALYEPISEIGEGSVTGWMTWIVVIISSTFCFYLNIYQIYLTGINQVSLVQRVTAVSNFVGIVVFLVLTSINPNLFYIVLVFQIVALINYIFFWRLSKMKKYSILWENKKVEFNKKIFSVIWDNAWKGGVATVIANFVKHISGIFVAQFFSPSISASFLFTKKLFEVLETFMGVTFLAKIPKIASLRGRGDFVQLIPLLSRILKLSYMVYLLGYLILVFFGSKILILIKGNTELGSIDLIILFSFSHLFGRWGGFNMTISNQSNSVVEHKSAIITFAVFTSVVFFFYEELGVLVFPIAVIVSTLINLPFLYRKTYYTLNTTFFSFEKHLFIPVLFVLGLINLVYYLL